VAKTSDGYWTVPYFDCGGGNVLMVTYVAPLLKEHNGSVVFQLVYFRSVHHCLK
jgi:G protein-coupled receptor 158